jgi:transposase
LKQLLFELFNRRLGHVGEEYRKGPAIERLGWKCTSPTWTVRHVPWGVRAKSASTGPTKHHGWPGEEGILTESYRFFVGIDWAWNEHTICVLGSGGEVVDRRTIQHSAAGLAQLADFLEKLSSGNPSSVAGGIEMPRGAIVEHLVERGFAVYSLNPKQMDRFRDRHTVAGAKDDSRDAYVIGDALRTDLHLFHRVRLDHPEVLRIRELSRNEEDVVQDQVRTGNRLQDLLNRYYPQMLQLCPAVDQAWFWDLLEMAPLPALAVKLSKKTVEKLLRAYRIRRFDADEICQTLSVSKLQLAPGAAEAASEHVLLILPVLRLLDRQREEIARRMQELLEKMSEDEQSVEHRDVKILLSLPGVGRVISATMLAEASQPLAERDYHAIRSYAGAAPITRQSGKRKMVVMRRGCNPRLRNALYHWSRVSTQHDPHSKEHYAALRAKGHSHGRALRGVADRLLAVLIAMLRNGTPYDPNHKAVTSSK